MTAVFVKRFITQHCIGYSADFKETYIENEVEYSDGSIRKMYSTYTTHENGTQTGGELYSFRPAVSVPLD